MNTMKVGARTFTLENRGRFHRAHSNTCTHWQAFENGKLVLYARTRKELREKLALWFGETL
jgi:hypothetical protein